MGSYFIRIEDGPDLRRKLLESSKASLHVLKGYQVLLVIRSEKLSAMDRLRQELRELSLLINRAESLMPQLTEREMEELNPKPRPVEAPKTVAQGKWVKKGGKKVYLQAPKAAVETVVQMPLPDLTPAPKEEIKVKPLTELERLEQALAAIDTKLGKMS